MTDKTLYFVQPFRIRRGKLAASGASTFREADAALQAGVAIARRQAGVVVLAQSYDAERHVLLPPRVLRVHGQIPAEWSGTRQAA